ncbi:hypothetical protein OG613_48230 (plasmid) [Streptomyces sp. NBC_00015]|uniref:carbamoyltransferase family protein n=1 Tax=Streptomyces sp. NBC_00015 TaxID=2903611 RepID=UPI003249A49F
MSILGLNLSHDSSVCLVQDGRIIAALSLERTTGVKRGVVPAHVYPAAMAQLTQTLLSDSGLQAGDIDYWIATSTESRDQADEERLSDTLGLLTKPERKLSLPHPGHHLAHASAAFYTSGLPEAAALVIDAYGSRLGTGRERETAFVFRRGESPDVLWRATREESRIAGRERDGALWIPVQLSGIGELYRVVTLALGFAERGSTYDDAGKTMGLAAYGHRFSSENIFMRADGGRLSFEGAAEALIELKLAVRRGDGLELIPRASDDPVTRFHHDLAAQIQSEFEEACLYLVEDVLARSSTRNLVLSGGCFLNSMLNARIARECDVDRLFVFPAATDDGNAAGAALYAHHVLLGEPAPDEPTEPQPALRHVFLGPSRLSGSTGAVEESARAWGLNPIRHGTPREAAAAAAEAIARGEIIGWFQDRAEFGPRSLGARSILCHPGIPGMKERLNARVKFRESFRPFAASVLAERAREWFDLPVPESPFMLMVCPILPGKAAAVREITHVDGTCRLQTVDNDLPGTFRTLIEEFEARTGLPLVLNTSFNVRGRPIVEDVREALECLYGTRLDRVFVGDYEIPGPDLASLYPSRIASMGGELADGLDQELLQRADGRRTVRELAASIGLDEDAAIDHVLALRRRSLLRWDGLPERPEPRFPLPQYDPQAGA